ncbi:ArnT family glycosyltransferase [Persephonella sp.]
MKKEYFLIALVLFGFLAILSGSFDYRFRGEEPTRIVMAYEMEYLKNFFQPTYLGEQYFRKPPLFNWFVIISSKIWGWSEFTGRFVSLLFTVLTTGLVYIFSYKYVFKNIRYALFSALVFLSFIDVLFWYGFLAEIDITLTFFVFVMIISLIYGFEKNSFLLLSLASLFTGLAFLLKGFPAFVFYGATIFSIFVFRFLKKDDINLSLVLKLIFSVPIMFIPIVLWLINLLEPETYLKVLWSESFGRVKKSTEISEFLWHLIFYPVLNLKQTLLISVFFISVLVFNLRKIKNISFSSPIVLIITVFLINYLPYYISAGARGRYILPLIPLLAIFIVYVFKEINSKKVFRILTGIIIFSFTARLLIGLFYFPYETEKKGLYKKIAVDIYEIIPSEYYSKITSNCDTHKAIIFYLDSFTEKIVLSEDKMPDWKYMIGCKKLSGENIKIVKEYNYKGQKIRLYKRE